MRERINRLAKGIIDENMPRLAANPTSIKHSIRADESFKNEILIESTDHTNLKGLAYSTNQRVKVLTPSFGGNKNKVVYEVGAKYLQKGDVISGNIHLVTNGGEQDIPYVFDIELGIAGKTLNSLKTVDDFAKIVKEDSETALRLFEYKDFTDAPFMSDIRINSLYNCFLGRANKLIAIEEFLVACHAKSKTTLSIEKKNYSYDDISESTEIQIPIKKSGWGYIEVSLKSTEDYLIISKRSITNRDFIEDSYVISATIDPTKLHKGRNIGEIIISTINEDWHLSIEVLADEAVDIDYLKDRYLYHKNIFASYMCDRLEYECESLQSQKMVIAERMLKSLEKLSTWTEKKAFITVLKSEAAICCGDNTKAESLANEVRDEIKNHRQEQLFEYFILEYVDATISDNDNKKESLIRLIKKFMEEEKMHILYPLLVKLDKHLELEPTAVLNLFFEEYNSGSRNPYMFLSYVRAISKQPEYLHDIGAKESAALSFGLKHHIIDEKLAEVIADRALTIRKYTDVNYRLLTGLYELYPGSALINAICSMLIKGDVRKAGVHSWFERGIDKQCDITGLYRYYLYTLPDDYDDALPKEVIEYFSTHDDSLDTLTRTVLYENILKKVKPETYVFRAYKDKIHSFALEQAHQGNMDTHLAYIYDKELDSADIDDDLAQKLPDILSSYYIECKSKLIKNVLVLYMELNKAQVYSLVNHKACVPIYTDEAIILFQDAYGNRYYDIKFNKKAAIHKPDLIEACYEVYPEHMMLKIKSIKDILSKHITSIAEAGAVEKIMSQLDLSSRYKQLAFSALIKYYRSMTQEHTSIQSAFLIMTDKSSMTVKERSEVCSSLIEMGYYREAYDMIKEYNCEDISNVNLEILCNKTILDKLFNQEPLLLHLAYNAISRGSKSKVLLDYLCEHFNGSTQEMLLVWDTAIQEDTETYDLEERLLAQMLFSENYKDIDRVFRRYIVSKKRSESIIKAYFTVKCARYFLLNEPMEVDLFDYLERTYASTLDNTKIPTIYALTLAKYYASQNELDLQHKEIASRIIYGLIDDGLIFPFYKRLAGSIHIPQDIMEKATIVYRGKNNKKPQLRMRILPGQDEFTEEEMRHMYLNIYIKEQVLFSGETWEFKLYNDEDDMTPSKEGSIAGGNGLDESDTRYACLNTISALLSGDNNDALCNKMKDYIIMDEMVHKLFDIK